MGIKTEVTQDELPSKYKKFTLSETKDGLSHSVYLLENEYVLKIVEGNTQDTILNEKKLLNLIQCGLGDASFHLKKRVADICSQVKAHERVDAPHYWHHK